MYTTITPTDALASARRARILAERALRRSELERDQTARALEQNVHPLDETTRSRLRFAYADAAASVAAHREVFERAVSIERAATVIAAVIDDPAVDSETVDGLVQLLEYRRRRPRDVAPPVAARARRATADVRAPLG